MDSQALKESIETRLRAQIQRLDNTFRDLDAGEMNELEGLDDDVEQIIDDIKTLPQDIAQLIEPLMLEMISKLEKLAIALQEHQAQAEAE